MKILSNKKARCGLALIILFALSSFYPATALAERNNETKYNISVQYSPYENINPEIQYDLSYLTARMIYHVLEAVRAIDIDRLPVAQSEIGKAKTQEKKRGRNKQKACLPNWRSWFP